MCWVIYIQQLTYIQKLIYIQQLVYSTTFIHIQQLVYSTTFIYIQQLTLKYMIRLVTIVISVSVIEYIYVSPWINLNQLLNV